MKEELELKDFDFYKFNNKLEFILTKKTNKISGSIYLKNINHGGEIFEEIDYIEIEDYNFVISDFEIEKIEDFLNDNLTYILENHQNFNKVKKMKEELRCYHFGNFYLSSIQQGIQAAHAQMELFVKYYNKEKEDLIKWAAFDKTMICLNGGMDSDLQDIKLMFDTKENKYAWSYFIESKEALNNTLTNIAIILPEKIFLTASYIRNKQLLFIVDNSIKDKLFLIKNNKNNFFDENIYNFLNRNYSFNSFEIKLINLINSCRLAN